MPPFEPLSGPLGDLGGERPHGEGMEKGLDDLFPLPYPRRSKTEERKSWTEWRRTPHRRHRLRHEKRRREKETRELLLLDTGIGSLLQEERRTPPEGPDGGHHARPQGPGPEGGPSHPALLDPPATTQDLLLLLLRPDPSSKFRSGADDGREKQEGSSSTPPPDEPSTTHATTPERPLFSPDAHPSGSRGTVRTHSLASLFTPTTALDEEGALRTLRDQDGGRRTFLNASLRLGGQEEEVQVVVEAAGDTTFNHLTDAEKDHPTISVATLPESSSSSGSPPPDVTGKPQDPARDPSESYKRQAITPGGEELNTPRMNLQSTRKNSESMMAAVRANESGETLEYISKSLLTPTSLSARQTGDQDKDEAPARPRDDERHGGDADGVEVEEPNASTLQPLPDVSRGAPASDSRPERNGGSAGPPEPPAVETGGLLPPAGGDAAEETELRERKVEITSRPKVSGEPNVPHQERHMSEDSFLNALVTTSSGVVPYPARERSLRRVNTTPSNDLPVVPSSTSPCYTSYDLVVVVLLTSLANLVTFVMVTLLLCWCSLRARGALPPPQPRPLHLDDHNNDHLDDDAEETA